MQRRDQPPFGVGSFQLRILFSLGIVGSTYTIHYESFRLTAGVMDHWCRRPDNYTNLSVADWKELAIPFDDHGERSHCLMHDPPDADNATRAVPCKSWEFDLDQYGNNVVSEWGLVCDRRWLINLARLIYSAACMLSLPVTGAVADRVGRKTFVFITLPVVLITGVASSLPNDFQFFVAVRAIVSAATSALVPPMVALLFEVSPMCKAPAYLMASFLSSVVTVYCTLYVAEVIKGGWATLQLVLMVPTFLLLLLYYCVDESPAWLLARGNAKEAEVVALRAAAVNDVPERRCRELFAEYQAFTRGKSPGSQANTSLCTAQLRTRTILLAYTWVALSFAYDTFVANDGVLVGGVAMVLGYALSAVACLLTTPVIPRIGFRRVVVAAGLAFSASSATLAAVYSEKEDLLRDCLVISMRVAGNVAFSLYFFLTVNSYPILVHGKAVATGLACSRLGDTFAQMSDLFISARRTDVRLALAAAAMALFAAGVELLPAEADWTRNKSATPTSDQASDGSKHAMRQTLQPLPKQRVKRRVDKPRARRSSVPEQRAVRPADATRLSARSM